MYNFFQMFLCSLTQSFPLHIEGTMMTQRLTPTPTGDQRRSRMDMFNPPNEPSATGTAGVADTEMRPPNNTGGPQSTPAQNPAASWGDPVDPMDEVTEEGEDEMEVDMENDGTPTENGRNVGHRQPKWTDDENTALVHSVNENNEDARGRFQGGTGGRERKKAAWARIASEFF